MPRFFDAIDDHLSTAQDGATGIDVAPTTHAIFVYIFNQPASSKTVMQIGTQFSSGIPDRRINVRIPSSSGWRVEWTHEFSTSNGQWLSPDQTVGAWHQVVIVYDASSVTNNPTIYVDNVSVSVTENSTPGGTRVTGLDTLRLGQLLANGQVLDGEEAFVCIANALWGTSQVNRHYWYGNPGGPVALAYPFVTDDLTNKGTITTANLSAYNGSLVVPSMTNAQKGFVLLRSCT